MYIYVYSATSEAIHSDINRTTCTHFLHVNVSVDTKVRQIGNADFKCD